MCSTRHSTVGRAFCASADPPPCVPPAASFMDDAEEEALYSVLDGLQVGPPNQLHLGGNASAS